MDSNILVPHNFGHHLRLAQHFQLAQENMEYKHSSPFSLSLNKHTATHKWKREMDWTNHKECVKRKCCAASVQLQIYYRSKGQSIQQKLLCEFYYKKKQKIPHLASDIELPAPEMHILSLLWHCVWNNPVTR